MAKLKREEEAKVPRLDLLNLGLFCDVPDEIFVDLIFPCPFPTAGAGRGGVEVGDWCRRLEWADAAALSATSRDMWAKVAEATASNGVNFDLARFLYLISSLLSVISKQARGRGAAGWGDWRRGRGAGSGRRRRWGRR